MTGKATRDPRLHHRGFSWKNFLLVFGVLVLLASGQTMIGTAFPDTVRSNVAYSLAGVAYWAIVSAVFCLVLARQQRRVFDRPMRQLSDAAQKVAGGDFSVRLTPAHAPDHWDYVDVMFDDFNTMVIQLQSIETLKDDFIADVSHEIRTPLAIIANYANALRVPDTLEPEVRQEYVETIAQATSRLSVMISNILRLDKLDNQRLDKTSGSFDLPRQLAEVALTFSEAFDAKGIDFTAELEDDLVIQADEGMLEVVWQNLLSNAIKFTPARGIVTLSQTSTPEAAIVRVQDSGCGMNEVTKGRIFEKFYQGDTEVSGEGNGLGLALVKRVAQLVGASVEVSSAPNEGSTFTVTIPRHVETP
ncbi:MAG: HAMP domain-containing histidine kinase [Propionibacteriaceae bacterium]|jgi:signal transduction histidine kinase|nr:HAMP domain-containing histidine kinase [Propionibacteriaceae bacterium]